MKSASCVLLSLMIRPHKPKDHWLKIKFANNHLLRETQAFCPEIILSCDADPPTFIRSVSRFMLQGSGSFAKCPSMMSQIQKCYVSLSCHPASTLRSTSTTTQHGRDVSEASWYRLFWTAGYELLFTMFAAQWLFLLVHVVTMEPPSQ